MELSAHILHVQKKLRKEVADNLEDEIRLQNNLD